MRMSRKHRVATTYRLLNCGGGSPRCVVTGPSCSTAPAGDVPLWPPVTYAAKAIRTYPTSSAVTTAGRRSGRPSLDVTRCRELCSRYKRVCVERTNHEIWGSGHLYSEQDVDQAVKAAELIPLLCAVAELTGDRTLLADEFRPKLDLEMIAIPAFGGLSDEVAERSLRRGSATR